MISHYDALNEMFALVKAGVESSDVSTIIGYTPQIVWQFIQPADKPDGSKFWLRVSANNISDEQTSFAEPLDGSFTTEGLIVIQIYGPFSDHLAGKKIRQLAEFLRNLFRKKSTPGGVWFRRASLIELESDKNIFHRINVQSEYTFDN